MSINFRYSIHPKEYGQFVSFEDGILRTGDWTHERNMDMSVEDTRALYEVMKEYFNSEK